MGVLLFKDLAHVSIENILKSCLSILAMTDRSEYNKQYRKEHQDKIKEYKKNYYQQNKEIIAEKTKKYRDALSDERKAEMAEKAIEYRQNNNDKLNMKIPCDICGSVVLKRQMTQHKLSLKCQSYIPDREVVPLKKITCDRCGKEVVATNICKHMDTLQCQYFPALKLGVPMKLILDRERKLLEGLTMDDDINKLCEEYKDGHAAPIKEMKPWQIKNEQLRKEIYGDEPIVWNIVTEKE